jgi:hypothetical protein
MMGLLVGMAGMCGCGMTRPAGAVRGKTTDTKLVLENTHVRVEADRESGAYSITCSNLPFIAKGALPQARKAVGFVNFTGPLGKGKAIEVLYEDGGADLFALYPGVPFALFQHRIHNAGKGVSVTRNLTPVSFQVDLCKSASDIQVLGCDGLTRGVQERASYTFLAAADPVGGGAVAGWLTHNRASGIVFSHPGGNLLRFEGLSQYGALRLPQNASAEGEWFALGFFDNTLDGLEAYAEAIAAFNHVRLPPIPNGYCTWYSEPNGGASDEKHVAEFADFCKKNLTDYGFRVVQIDDRWQNGPERKGGPRSDFTTHRPDGPYPGGMKKTADKIAADGLTPGLWILPFAWDYNGEPLKNHKDWFVLNEKTRKIYEVFWAGPCLDMTNPAARQFLHGAIRRISQEWGYKYLKLDGLWSGMACNILYPEPTFRDDKLGNAVFHDPYKTNVEAYRDGLALVRDAAGKDTYLLGCCIAQNMRTLGASFGRVDGIRVGRDIGAAWPDILPSAEMGSRLYFLHNRVWHNDPDCLLVREPLTLDQARAWGSWIAVSGQLNMVSEWLPGLPAERLDIVKRTMPNHGLCGRPVDLFESPIPRVWHLKDERRAVRRDVVALFNWDAGKAVPIRVDLKKLGLPPSKSGQYVGFDFWANEFVAPFQGELACELKPSSCRVLAIRPIEDHPILVSTSRHITQGMVDVEDESWDPGTRCLSGTSGVVGGDPCQLRIFVPGSAGVKKAMAVETIGPKGRKGVISTIQQEGPCVRVQIVCPSTCSVRWKVRFS